MLFKHRQPVPLLLKGLCMCCKRCGCCGICIQQHGHKCALHLRQKRSIPTVCCCVYLSVQVGLLCNQMDCILSWKRCIELEKRQMGMLEQPLAVKETHSAGLQQCAYSCATCEGRCRGALDAERGG